MAPGALSILAPFLGRKSNKKYEKLQADDPEKRRQEATQEEINRLNTKIEKLVTSMSREDIDLVANSEDACVVCCKSRAIMQVSPCGHQSLCRLCFVHNIREAVANRELPLRCLICNAKIARVKNNRSGNGTGPEHPVHVRGQTTKQLSPPSSLKGSNILRNQSQSKQLPTSVSGYSLCATQGDFVDEDNEDALNEARNNNYVQDQLTAFTNATQNQQKLRQSVIYNQKNESTYSNNQNQLGSGSAINSRATGLAMSASNYSMSSALSSMSSSSFESQRSIRSSASLQSAASYRSAASNSSWFSIGSFSNFQAGGIMDPKAMNRAPRAHSLTSRGKLRGKGFISSSPSTHSVKSWNGPQTNSGSQPLTKSEALNNRRNLAASFSSSGGIGNRQVNQLAPIRPSMSLNDVPLSPNSIDERIRAIQSTLLTAKSNSEKNISNLGAQSPPSNNFSKMNTTGSRNGITDDINTRETNMRPTGIISSSHNVMGMKNFQNIKVGKENKVSFPNNSVVSSNGLANLNYNPELPHHSPKQDSSVNRVSHGSITPGRECFRQGRANNGLTTKMNNGNIETGTSVGNGYNTKDLSAHTSLNIDKFSHSSKGPMRRLSGNGSNDKHFRKDSGRSRFAKSPENMETTYSMTTIEEEQENVSVALSLRNLSQLEDNNSIKSFNECSDD